MIVVVGMHRSGTSAVTELLEHAGFGAAAAQFAPSPWNPHGNHESRPLTAFNERLLRALGGRWDCPPPLPAQWWRQRPAARLRRRARRVFAAQTPPPGVWKDPRLCIVLPFWEDVLAERPPAVLVYRHPAEVADSLQRRNGFAPALGLALWERYLRTALDAVAGHRVLAVRYDAVIADPAAFVADARSVLATFGVTPGAAAPAATIAAATAPAGGREPRARDAALSTEQEALDTVLAGLPATSTAFAVTAPGDETATTAGIIAEQRTLLKV